jgi:hypothetical protein
MRRLFLGIGALDFESNRGVQLTLERRHVTMGGPELQLDIASCAKTGEIVLATRKQINRGDRLRVAPIETFCQAHNRAEHTNRRAEAPAEIGVPLV